MASSSGQSIKFEMLVGVDGLIDGLKVATKGVEQSAQAIKLGLGSTGAAAKSAAKEHEGFTGTLKAFKSEQVAGGKVARYYADQIANIIPEAAGAKGAIGGMIEALSGGLGIGAGIGIAISAFTLLSEHVQAAEKQARDLKDAYLDTSESIGKSLRAVADGLAEPITATSAAWRAEAEKIREEMAKTQREINARTSAAANPGLWGSIVGTVEQTIGIGSGSGKGFKSGADEEIEALHAQSLARIRALDDKKAQRDAVAAKEEVKRKKEMEDDVWNFHRDYQVRVDEEAKAEREKQNAAFLELEQAERLHLKRLTELHARAEGDKAEILRRYHAERLAQQQDQAQREEDAVAAIRAPWEDLAGSLANTWAGLMQGMIRGAKSFGDVLQGVFDSVLENFLSMVTQMVAKAAILGILNFIFPGAGFAVGGAAAGLGAIFGSVAKPSGSSFSGATLAMGGGGGGSLNLSIHALDGQSAYRTFTSPAVVGALREARRNGIL